MKRILIVLALVAAVVVPGGAQRPGDETNALADFDARIKAYAALRERLEKGAAELAVRAHVLVGVVRRPGAREHAHVSGHARGVRAAHIRKTEAIVIVSQKKKSVSRSPAKTAPRAAPA